MASFVVDNNVESTVADNPLVQSATTLNVANGEGANFPSTFPFRLTIWGEAAHPDPGDDSGMEIVECTARSTDALTIARGKDGTGDVAHANGERVALLITAGLFNDATYGITTKLDGIEAGADVTDATNVNSAGAVMETDYNAQTILRALTDNNPGAMSIGEETLVGRRTSGNVDALSAISARALLNVDNGADVTGSNPPQAHGASVHTDRTREVFIPVPVHNTGSTTQHGVRFATGVTSRGYYNFKIPIDFVSVTDLYIYYICDAGSNNVDLSLYTYYGAHGEAKNAHSGADSGNVIAISDTNKQRFQTVNLLASAAVGDTINLTVQRNGSAGTDTNAGNMDIVGVLLTYTADM